MNIIEIESSSAKMMLFLIRKKFGSVAAMARNLKVSRNSIYKAVNGQKSMRRLRLEIVAELFGGWDADEQSDKTTNQGQPTKAGGSTRSIDNGRRDSAV